MEGKTKTEEIKINKGYSFIPTDEMPDCYLSENIATNDISYCDDCKNQTIKVKGTVYCPRCYMNNRSTYNARYTDEIKEFMLTLLIDSMIEQPLQPPSRNITD